MGLLMLWEKFRAWIMTGAAVLASALAIYAYGRKSGAEAEGEKRDESDRKQARKIEDAADDARRNDGDAIDRLRKHGRLRD